MFYVRRNSKQERSNFSLSCVARGEWCDVWFNIIGAGGPREVNGDASSARNDVLNVFLVDARVSGRKKLGNKYVLLHYATPYRFPANLV